MSDPRPGILAHLDGYMNIAMEQTEEYQNGVLKPKYGDAFIRGNNGAPLPLPLLYMSLPRTHATESVLTRGCFDVRAAVLYISSVSTGR